MTVVPTSQGQHRCVRRIQNHPARNLTDAATGRILKERKRDYAWAELRRHQVKDNHSKHEIPPSRPRWWGGVSAQSQDELMKKTATIAPSCPCGFEARGQSENQRPGDFA